MINRRTTRAIKLGNLRIGGNNPIYVQSMTNTDTRDIEATLSQVERLTNAGCEIVRLAVPDEKAARAIGKIRDSVSVPIIADIHFDYRLALKSLESGADGLRINPGNIRGKKATDMVVDAAKAAGASIRIGVNSGSLEKELLQKYGAPTPQAMAESALRHVGMLENRNFDQIKVSLKSSSVTNTLAAYRELAKHVDYPFHIGITEAGTILRGSVKSSVGIGILLWEGLGDTMRVSLTADPVKEVAVAWEILRSLGIRERGPEIISCPTCGRTEINLVELAEKVEEYLQNVTRSFKVAVMGCVVNGPGEAAEADIGIAGGRNLGIVFKKGRIVRKIRGSENLIPVFLEELNDFLTGKPSHPGE